MAQAIKILGVSDERTTCDACGKRNLKCTVALEIDGAEPVFFGRDCAARAIYGATDRAKMERVERRARAITFGEKLVALAATDPRWTPELIAGRLWDRFGFSTYYDRRAGTISIGLGETPHVLRVHDPRP